jgi:dTDP-4-dehydrorhamnose reductase
MAKAQKKVLVLGASGMLGSTVLRYFNDRTDFDCFGTLRSNAAASKLPANAKDKLLVGIDVLNSDQLAQAMVSIRPDVVINCIGLVKQLASASDPLSAIPINSLLPHRLERVCRLSGSRLVHMSTDCVFSGRKGMYTEEDESDCRDLYGRSKFLGEVDSIHAVTLRTSIIGHELGTSQSLLEWFLSQKSKARGFTRAVFSGLPTVEVARVIADFVIPQPSLSGVYNLSAEAISKFDLLKMVAKEYEKEIELTPDDSLVIDRSLDSTKLRKATGFVPKSWPDMISIMRKFG